MSLMMRLPAPLQRERVASDHQLDGLALPDAARKPLRAAVPGSTPRFTSGKPDLPASLRAIRKSAPWRFPVRRDAMSIDRGKHQLRLCFQPQQHFVGVQAEVILKRRDRRWPAF